MLSSHLISNSTQFHKHENAKLGVYTSAFLVSFFFLHIVGKHIDSILKEQVLGSFFLILLHLVLLLLFFFTLQYCLGFAIHWLESAPLPSPSPFHPSGSSQYTSPKHPVSCIKPGLAIHFTYDILHVSMPFSQIILPLPSPTEAKRLLYTSVSLLLSRIQDYRYHLSKFHIYAFV